MSSFPSNVAQSPVRNVYMPLPPGVFPGTMAVPARFPQGFPVHADINAINRPAMGQSTPPAQPASAQQGGSVWPWVIGGALGLGALYYGYQWMSKPKAVEETAEKLEGEAADLAKGETEKLADAAASTTSEKAVQGATADTKGAVAAAKKDAATIIQEGAEQAEHKAAQALETTGKGRLGSMASRMGKGAWNVATHKGTLAGIALAGGIVLDRMVPTLRPAAIALGAEVPGMLWKSCAESAKQCTPGLAQKTGNGLVNIGTGIGAFATTAFAASRNFGSGVLAKVWNNCGETAAKECIPGFAQKSGADQALKKGMDYVPTSGEDLRKMGNATLEYLPTIEGAKKVGNTVWDYMPSVEGAKKVGNTVWEYMPGVEGAKKFGNAVWEYKPTVQGAKNFFGGAWSYVAGAKNASKPSFEAAYNEAVRIAKEQGGSGPISAQVGRIMAEQGYA